jgi:hemoglobin
MATSDPSPQVASARPEMTAAIMGATDLDDAVLRHLVHGFYGKVRRDPVLGPVFAARITDWEPHLERMVAFWSSVALMSGRYHGRPVPAHTPLPIGAADFDRWLALFRATARETCSPAGAAHVIERAERIARSLRIAVEEAQAAPEGVPALRG